MPCCPVTPIVFTDTAISVIPYTPIMQQQYGPTPRVYIWYRDAETDEYLQSSWFTFQAFGNSNITVDHGGPQTGFIVIR